jgi:hypothetical protein
MPTNSCVEYWCVGGTARQYLPLTLADVSGHLAADWVLLATTYGPLRQFILAHPKSLIFGE